MATAAAALALTGCGGDGSDGAPAHRPPVVRVSRAAHVVSKPSDAIPGRDVGTVRGGGGGCVRSVFALFVAYSQMPLDPLLAGGRGCWQYRRVGNAQENNPYFKVCKPYSSPQDGRPFVADDTKLFDPGDSTRSPQTDLAWINRCAANAQWGWELMAPVVANGQVRWSQVPHPKVRGYFMELYTGDDVRNGLIVNRQVADDWSRRRGFVPVINIAARTSDSTVASYVLSYCRAASGWIGLYSGQAVEVSRVRAILSALELCTSA